MSVYKYHSWLLSVCMASAPALATDTIIDFEDSTGTTASFESRGYRFTTNDATVLGISPDYEIWALSGYYSFNMFETNGDPFTLKQMSVRMIGNLPVYAVGVITFRGNIDGGLADQPDISDLVYLVTYMFQGGAAPPCMEEADVDGSGTGPDIADLVYLVTYMFQGGPAPALCP